MIKRLLNRSEETTYDALNRICHEHGVRVAAKVRVADIFQLEGSGVSHEQFSYGLKSHFDFVVTNNDHLPLFSVEYDGPLHQQSETQKSRDRLKNELCTHFDYSLLRINSRYISSTYRGLDLLTYFIETWFLAEAFGEAQDAGHIPYDEPFDPAMVVTARSGGQHLWPYWLSHDAQSALWKLHDRGLIAKPGASDFVGIGEDGNYRCMAWVEIDDANVVASRTGMRAQQFKGVLEVDLIRMIATCDLHKSVEQCLRGDQAELMDREQFFRETLPRFRQVNRMVAAGGWTRPPR